MGGFLSRFKVQGVCVCVVGGGGGGGGGWRVAGGMDRVPSPIFLIWISLLQISTRSFVFWTNYFDKMVKSAD